MKRKVSTKAVALIVISVSVLSIIVVVIMRSRIITQEQLEKAYCRQNRSFNQLVSFEREDDMNKYLPLDLSNANIEGVDALIYSSLVYYSINTRENLTYDQVVDYFSQEFEDDGKIRIYINGRHPEIAAYIEWIAKNSAMCTYNAERINDLYHEYADEHEEFLKCPSHSMPTEMIDELIKKEDYSLYEMDLIIIQKRYIAEGKAVVSEDGETIEFILP